MTTTDNILLVDDDPGTIQLLGRILSGAGQLRFAMNGPDALRMARETAPDLVLLDAQMPGMDGFEVLKALKADPALADVPVIFVTSHREPEFEVAGFGLGASDFIVKPVVGPLVIARVDAQLRIKRMADELRRISNVDALTGLANRRRFDAVLDTEWRRGLRAGDAISLLMIDVDHFKRYNDRYGHPTGDACLRRVAEALQQVSLRPADLVARYGGEEFAVVLPGTRRAGAEQVARRCLGAVAALAIPHDASPTATCVSISVGVASYEGAVAGRADQADPARTAAVRPARCAAVDLIEAADKALYGAKQAGRARAEFIAVAARGSLPGPHQPVTPDR